MLPKPESCRTCRGWGWGPMGFVPPAGSGDRGVLVVCEAAGEQEAALGMPLVGKAGQQFQTLIERAGYKRDDFRLANVLSCRPPDNRISPAWADEVARSCAPNLDAEIERFRPKAILACGDYALRRLLPEVDQTITKARGYAYWSERYAVWIVPTYHPSFIMRGNFPLSIVWITDCQKAVMIAREGYAFDEVSYLMDPTPRDALAWVEGFEREGEILSFDIETPGKADEDEDELEQDRQDYMILRVSFAYKPLHAMSIPATGPYVGIIERLLSSKVDKLVWNAPFDIPRLHVSGYTINGAVHDGMIAWHILHSDLRKGLGFVGSLLLYGQPAWKHLAAKEAAYYNAVDADAALRCFLKTIDLLKETDLWRVYEEDVLRLDPVLAHMTAKGMPIDQVVREEMAKELAALEADYLSQMQGVIPESVSKLKVYKREPKETAGLEQVEVIDTVRRCPGCGLENPTKPHFKVYKKKENPCGGLEPEETEGVVTRWARRIPFVPSLAQLTTYQAALGRQVPLQGRGKERKPTMDNKAIEALRAKHPEDQLYPLVLSYREVDKIGGTYIGRWEDVD